MAQVDRTKLELGVAEEPPAVLSGEDTGGVSFPELLIVLAKRRSFILKFVGVATALAVLVSLLLPATYTANAKLMPPQQNQSMSATAILSQLGPLAALAGQGLGLRNSSDLYVAMLHSRVVADGLIDRFSLMSVYGVRQRVSARERLQGKTEIIAGKDGIISIYVEDRDPRRAADIANAYIEELEQLTKTLAVTEAAKRRVFFEREVKTAADDLATAELALKQTQEKTGLIQLDSQSKAMIEALTSLRARIAAQEVLVQSMRSYATPENPDLIRAEKELAALREQGARLEGGDGERSFADVPIEKVPTAGLEYVRKLREVKYREALFELLAKQYEAAKIDEARDASIVQELDKALPPEIKSGPHRTLIVLAVAFLAFAVAAGVALFMEAMEKAKDDPLFVARLQTFRLYLYGKPKS